MGRRQAGLLDHSPGELDLSERFAAGHTPFCTSFHCARRARYAACTTPLFLPTHCSTHLAAGLRTDMGCHRIVGASTFFSTARAERTNGAATDARPPTDRATALYPLPWRLNCARWRDSAWTNGSTSLPSQCLEGTHYRTDYRFLCRTGMTFVYFQRHTAGRHGTATRALFPTNAAADDACGIPEHGRHAHLHRQAQFSNIDASLTIGQARCMDTRL